MTNTIIRAELTGITAALTNKYSRLQQISILPQPDKKTNTLPRNATSPYTFKSARQIVSMDHVMIHA